MLLTASVFSSDFLQARSLVQHVPTFLFHQGHGQPRGLFHWQRAGTAASTASAYTLGLDLLSEEADRRRTSRTEQCAALPTAKGQQTQKDLQNQLRSLVQHRKYEQASQTVQLLAEQGALLDERAVSTVLEGIEAPYSLFCSQA